MRYAKVGPVQEQILELGKIDEFQGQWTLHLAIVVENQKQESCQPAEFRWNRTGEHIGVKE